MARHGRTFPIKAHMNYQGRIGIYFNRTFSNVLAETVVVTGSLVRIMNRFLTDTVTLVDSFVQASVRTLMIAETVIITSVMIVTNTILLFTNSIIVTGAVSFAKRARDFIMGRNNDTGIKVGKAI